MHMCPRQILFASQHLVAQNNVFLFFWAQVLDCTPLKRRIDHSRSIQAMNNLAAAHSPVMKRRRLNGKQSVGHAAPALVGSMTTMNEAGFSKAFLTAEDLEDENPGVKKAVYMVTLPHPCCGGNSAAPALRAPDSFAHIDVITMILDIFEHPVYIDPAAALRTVANVKPEKMVVFKENHAPNAAGKVYSHYHVALLLPQPMRFLAYKRALRSRWNVASHWSCSHDGYWSAVRYGVMPTPKKNQQDLDSKPVAWTRVGEQHPNLLDACQEPNTAAALQRRRVAAAKGASERGEAEPKASELDLYTVVVANGFRNTADDPWAHKRLIAHLKSCGSPALFQLAWRIRHRLNALVDDVWAWENVGDDLAFLGQSRWDKLLQARNGQCQCGCVWRQWAETSLQVNGINPVDLCTFVCQSLWQGRCESLPVVTLMGRSGGEGKSYFFSPLKALYGDEYVQDSPQPGNFPLLGLETKQVALLDEWDFNPDVVPFSTQLLWYEGKKFPITRPQNSKEYSGHLMYSASAPVFITCKEKHLGPIMQAAAREAAAQQASECTMLMRRLRVYQFTAKLAVPCGTRIPACTTCFAKLLSHYAAQGQA